MLGDLDSSPEKQVVNGSKKMESALETNDQSSDSDDDGPVIMRRKKKTLQRSMLADSSDDDGSGKENMVNSDHRSSSSGSDDEENITLGSFKKTPKRVLKKKILDDSSDEEEEPAKHSPPSVQGKNSRLNESQSSLKDNEDSDLNDEVEPSCSSKQIKSLNRDLFDAEDSESEGESQSKKSQNDDGSSDEKEDSNNDDNDEEEPEISEELRKKLAKLKGAAKKPNKKNPERTSRPKREDILDIHSESQRIIRESVTRIPYHQPAKIGLNVFLQRTKEKQDALKAVSNPRLAIKKPIPELLTPHLSNPATVHRSQPLKKATKETNKALPTMDVKDEKCTKSLESKNVDSDDELPDLALSKEEMERQEELKKAAKVRLFQDETEVNVNTANKTETEYGDISENTTVENTEEMDCGKQNLDSLTETNSGCVTETKCNLEQTVLQQNSEKLEDTMEISEQSTTGEHLDKNSETSLEASLKASDSETKTKTEDSGYLTHGNNSEEENSGDRVSVQKTEAEVPDCQVVVLADIGSPSDKAETGAGSTRCLPRLSGGPNEFVDLDDGEEGEPHLSQGVNELMERLMKHSTKRQKQPREIEMSTVHMVKGADNKDTLKLEKFMYREEGVDDEEDDDPKLKVPGAKLCRLKEKLQEQMKAKREEARQVRMQMYSLDNEEGYGVGEGEDEEEAELTDSEDSEPEFDEEEDVEQDLKDEPEKEPNPFVDDEAEDDDDDDYGDDNLHLELDTPAESQDGNGVDPKDFLKSALQKTKTLQLFDEDANTESPKMSQKSKPDDTEVSLERPFEQLSQGKRLCEAVSEELTKIGASNISDMDDSLSSVQLFKDKDRDSFASESMSSLDLVGTQIPAGQRTSRKYRRQCMDVASEEDLVRNTSGTPELYSPTKSKMADLALPIEDSQDLMGLNSSTCIDSTNRIPSQSFNFQLDDSQTTMSQMLDADGLLKVSSGIHKKPRRQLMLDSENVDDNELLGLCSGKFSEGTQKPSSRNPFGLVATQSANSDNMDEILGLCSGQFTGGSTQKVSNSEEENIDELLGLCSGKFSSPQKDINLPTSEGHDERVSGKFVQDSDDSSLPVSQNISSSRIKGYSSGLFSGKFGQDEEDSSLAPTQNVEDLINDSPVKVKTKKGKAVIVDDDDEESRVSFTIGSDDEEEEREDKDELGSDEEVPDKEKDEEFTFSKKVSKSKIRAAFAEDEAELSGSEYDSDENLDLAEEDDEMEAMSGDEDLLDMDEDELRNQVGRVHLKANIDQDKRDVAMLQEMYLADGDLHNEGKARMRRFKWKNIDDDTEQDLFNSDDEEDKAGGEDEVAEEKWRKERFEREKFLQEHEAEEKQQEGDSELLKLGKIVFKGKTSLRRPSSAASMSQNVGSKPQENKPPAASGSGIFKVPSLRSNHGSFLRRSAADLAKIAEMSKPAATVGGPRNSKNFVFQAKSPGVKEAPENTGEKKREATKPQVKRALSVQQPPAKRPCLEKSNSIPKDSIFHLFN